MTHSVNNGAVSECQVTREKILSAALELFATRGFVGASTREIAKKAGVAEVTLFRHFTSKERLLVEVINTYTFLPKLKDLLPQIKDIPYEEALLIIGKRLLYTLIERKDWIRIMHAEVQRADGALHHIYHSFLDELYETFSGYFGNLQKEGKLREFDPELAARAFQGMFFCFFNIEEILGRKHYKPTDKEKAVEEFVGIFINGTRLGGQMA